MHNLTKRLCIWAAVVAGLLLIPLILTLLGSGVDGDGVHWTLFDFVFMGVLLFGSALTYELVVRKMEGNAWYRAAVGLAVVTAVLLVWINGAVGIIGDDEWPNLLYLGMLALGLLFAIAVNFKPSGMMRILYGMAAAQMAILLYAFIAMPEIVSNDPPGLLGVFALNAIFSALWIGSGLLFRNALRA